MNIRNDHPFDSATKLTDLGGGKFAGETSADYANVVGTFGGVTAATMMRAVLENADRRGDPVAQTVNFCGSIGSGDFEVSTTMERAGKNTQHWSLKLIQNGEVKTTASIVCGVRSEAFSKQIETKPPAPEPKSCTQLKTKGLISWLERYSFRFVEGEPQLSGIPLSEQGNSRSLLWISDIPERPLDTLSLAAISDCFFPRLLHLRGKMVPFGTVSMTTYFHATTAEISTNGATAVLGASDSKRVHRNFHDQQMQLWASGGELLASGAQLVWYKE